MLIALLSHYFVDIRGVFLALDDDMESFQISWCAKINLDLILLKHTFFWKHFCAKKMWRNSTSPPVTYNSNALCFEACHQNQPRNMQIFILQILSIPQKTIGGKISTFKLQTSQKIFFCCFSITFCKSLFDFEKDKPKQLIERLAWTRYVKTNTQHKSIFTQQAEKWILLFRL